MWKRTQARDGHTFKGHTFLVHLCFSGFDNNERRTPQKSLVDARVGPMHFQEKYKSHKAGILFFSFSLPSLAFKTLSDIIQGLNKFNEQKHDQEEHWN